MVINGIKVREDLHRMLTQAEVDLEMWLAMRSARNSDDVVTMLNRGYGRFYMAAENALLNSMITILYAVFEVNKRSVNFWRLKDSLIGRISESKLVELEDTYASIKQTWKKISVIRNEVVGHQALERNASESHEIAGLTVDNAKHMLVACQELLFRIGTEFHDTHVVFNIKGAASFDKMLSDLREFHGSKRPDSTAE